MTKPSRQAARLAAHFNSLDELTMPAGLSARLRTELARARPRRRPVIVSVAFVLVVLVVAVGGFGLGRLSAPVVTVLPSPVATAAPISYLSLIGTTRDGNVVTVTLVAPGLREGSLSLARLRLSDGTELTPIAIVPSNDGSVGVRYSLPSQFAFARPEARIEVPFGTGVWVQSVDLK